MYSSISLLSKAVPGAGITISYSPVLARSSALNFNALSVKRPSRAIQSFSASPSLKRDVIGIRDVHSGSHSRHA